MSIAQSTTLQAYQLRAGGSRARMFILRMIAADSVRNANPHTRLLPGDWRGARSWKLDTYESAYGMLSRGGDAWYSHAGEVFRNERDASDVCTARMRHEGWYTDAHQNEPAIGIVASLPHGRFIAGYRWTANDERVYFPQMFDDANDAARMADEHARVFAESARDDAERFDAMTAAEHNAEECKTELGTMLPARNITPALRERVRDAIDALRKARDVLTEATTAYERG